MDLVSAKHSKPEQIRTTNLLLNQASNSLREVNATRQAIDAKILALLGLTVAIVSLLMASRAWLNLSFYGRLLFVAALSAFVVVIIFGVLASYPREVYIPYSRSILKFRDLAEYDDLARWVCEDLLELAEATADTIKTKSFWLTLMIMVVGFASAILVVSLIV